MNADVLLKQFAVKGSKIGQFRLFRNCQMEAWAAARIAVLVPQHLLILELLMNDSQALSHGFATMPCVNMSPGHGSTD